MSYKDQIVKEKLDFSGLFDFSAMYNYAHSWFVEEGYGVVEEKYSEKIAGDAKDISIEWKATKKMGDYFKVDIGIKFLIEKMSEVEVETEGKRKKMNKGKVGVDVKGTLTRDPESKWDSSTFNQFLRDLYDKYLIPNRISDAKDKVEGDVQDFKETMKAFLDLSGKR